MARSYGYNDSIFFNCPFDPEYMPLFRAIIFTIYRCGFYPKSALAEDNGLENRIDKIIRLIKDCCYGIHDISRTELNNEHLPRFNMPFELGVFFGARRYGDKRQRQKNGVILERLKYSYQHYLSDINGVDIKSHNNDPLQAMQQIRDWLRSASLRNTIPSFKVIRMAYKEFEQRLPAIVETLQLDINDIQFNDFCVIVEDVIREKEHF